MKNQPSLAIKKIKPQRSELNTLIKHFQNKQYDEAERLALTLTDKFKTHPFGWKVLGAVFNKTGRLSEGLIACQKSVELDPENAEAYYNMAVTLKELGRLEEAEENYRKTIALNPINTLSHFNLGNILKELDRLEEAEVSYKKAIMHKPDFADAYNNLGNTLHELSRLEESEESYKNAITLKPDFADAYNNLGITLKDLDRLQEAEEIYNKVIILKPEFTEALLNRGQLLFDRGEYEAALIDFDLCNTGSSRARSLSCLYALGRIEDIYKRIEAQKEVDGENLRIAAIASFIAEKEQKDTAHNFCKNPLEFIHFSNISTHFEDSNLFIDELIEELHNVKTTWEPYGRAAIKGFVTGKKFNLFASPSGKLAQLKAIINDEIDIYYSKFKNESCSYIQKWPSIKNLFGWHVILKQQGNQKVHIHPSGWLSGVIYLKVVPSLGKDEGSIEFGLSGKRYSHVDSPKFIHQPNLGDIVFFPSSLHHRTIPFTSDTDRIIVSFDLTPEGKQYLSYGSN